jgi:hypothetical protein
MGKLTPGGIQFTGGLDMFSAYTMRGHDGIIFRKKGGATKEQIEKHPKFEKTRNLNKEWKGVCMAGKAIRRGLLALKPLADYNISGPLHALVKKIQTSDTENLIGKRSILFSRFPEVLGSFHFNRQALFDSIIRQPIEVQIDKATAVIDLSIPLLQYHVNFFPDQRYAYFRIILSCTGLSDYTFPANDNDYYSLNYFPPTYQSLQTEWMITRASQPAIHYQTAPEKTPTSTAGILLICGAGIQYGMPGADGSIQPVPFAGAARILKTA